MHNSVRRRVVCGRRCGGTSGLRERRRLSRSCRRGLEPIKNSLLTRTRLGNVTGRHWSRVHSYATGVRANRPAVLELSRWSSVGRDAVSIGGWLLIRRRKRQGHVGIVFLGFCSLLAVSVQRAELFSTPRHDHLGVVSVVGSQTRWLHQRSVFQSKFPGANQKAPFWSRAKTGQ